MWIALAAGVLMLAIANAVVTLRLWRSAMYDRSQQVAQTAILWLIPGAAIIVHWFLREPSRKIPAEDPTYSNDGTTNWGLQGSDSHGDGPFGGGHH